MYMYVRHSKCPPEASSFDDDKQDCSNKISTSEQQMINEAAHDKNQYEREREWKASQRRTRNAAGLSKDQGPWTKEEVSLFSKAT